MPHDPVCFAFGRLVSAEQTPDGVQVVYRPHIPSSQGGGVGAPVAALLPGAVSFWDPRVERCSGKCIRVRLPGAGREYLSVRLWGEDSAQRYGEELVNVWTGAGLP